MSSLGLGLQHSWYLWPGHSCVLGPGGDRKPPSHLACGAELSSPTPTPCSISSIEPQPCSHLYRAVNSQLPTVTWPGLGQTGCPFSRGQRQGGFSIPSSSDLRTPPETHLSQLPPAQLAGPWGWPGSCQHFSLEQMLVTRRGGNLLSLFGSCLPCDEVPAGHRPVL